MENKETTTYSLKSLIQQYRIEIPKLQRDYAFGRKNAAEKRERLLETIQKHLDAKQNLKLDIIYGTTMQDDKLILLDGQQRVTTLFLLHWYMAVVGDIFSKFRELFYDKDNDRPRFCYNTRESSEDFCRILTTLSYKYKNHEDKPVFFPADIEAIRDPDEEISTVFRNQKWFLSKWNNDPTIAGMLNMLDAIKEKFPAEVCSEYYDSLVANDPAISFEFKNLEGFTKPDELYIKMNARGVELTRYEILKDFILEKLKEQSKRECISKKMDTSWLAFFWDKRPKKSGAVGQKTAGQYYPNVDLMMTNFITLLAIYNYIISDAKLNKDGVDQLKDEIKQLIDAKDKEAGYKIPYTTYQEARSDKQGDKTAEHIGYDKLINQEFITDIMKPAFDKLTNKTDKGFTVHQYLKDFKIHDIDDITGDIIDVLCNDYKNGEQLEKKLRAWAFIKFLYTSKPPNESELENWMRFVCNVGAATNVGNSIEVFVQGISAFDKLFEYNTGKTDPAKYIPDDWKVKEKEIKGLSKNQIREEIFKMKLSNKDDKWAKALKMAEGVGKGQERKLPYFEGTLRYVFRLIGLEECFAHDEIKIDRFDKASKLEEFSAYVDALHKIFPDETGCKCEPSLIRALLVQGDYTLPHNRNISLLQNNGRDISWRRLLKQDEYPEKLEMFTEIVKFVKDYKGPANDINGILGEFIKNNRKSTPFWCKCLCEIIEKAPEIIVEGSPKYEKGEISMSADRNIRHSGEEYYLLSKEQMNGSPDRRFP